MRRLSPRLLRYAPECITIAALVAITGAVLDALDAAHPAPEDGRTESEEQRLAQRLRGPLLRARRAACAYLAYVETLVDEPRHDLDERRIF